MKTLRRLIADWRRETAELTAIHDLYNAAYAADLERDARGIDPDD